MHAHSWCQLLNMQNKLKATYIQQKSIRLISCAFVPVLMLVQLHKEPGQALHLLLKLCHSLRKLTHSLNLALTDHYPDCVINPTSSFHSKSHRNETNTLTSILMCIYVSGYQQQNHWYFTDCG